MSVTFHSSRRGRWLLMKAIICWPTSFPRLCSCFHYSSAFNNTQHSSYQIKHCRNFRMAHHPSRAVQTDLTWPLSSATPVAMAKTGTQTYESSMLSMSIQPTASSSSLPSPTPAAKGCNAPSSTTKPKD